MARRRGRRRSGSKAVLAILVVLIGSGIYFRDTWSRWFTGQPEGEGVESQPVLTSDRPETGSLDGGPNADLPERGSDPALLNASSRSKAEPVQVGALLASAERAAAGGDPVLARSQYTEALIDTLSAQDDLKVRTELRKIGQQTIFSGSVFQNDPFASHHVIAPGERLHQIARAHSVTAEFLARINDIADMDRIQAGRRIKVVEGPFHAVVTLSTHTLDVYLAETFVDHFKVGLGADGSTPTGTWMVENKLKNPTYYPPRGGQIVHADDPENPLGERWIGLSGIEGQAVGQLRYGIHGTIEPDSVGKNVSMGCIRMHNEDVEFLFDLLIEKKSQVTVRE